MGEKFNVNWQSEEASLGHMTQEEREQGGPFSPPREVVSPTAKPGSWDYIIKIREKLGLGRGSGGKVKALAKWGLKMEDLVQCPRSLLIC